MRFMFKYLSAILILGGISIDVYSTDYIDFSYSWGKGHFDGYSINYNRSISTNFFGGVGWEYYEDKGVDRNVVKLVCGFIGERYMLLFRPFYYFKKDAIYAYGVKGGVNLFGVGDGLNRSISLNLGFIDRGGVISYTDFVGEMQIEFSFDDHIFLTARGSYNFNPKRYKGYIDYSNLAEYNYLGYLGDTLYSDVGVGYARSFKPDFNSYLYLSFDRINTQDDDINSYLIGLKTYLDEKERYFMDFGFNYADFRKGDNQRYYRIILGAFFNVR